MKLVLNLIIYCVILSVYLYLTLAINPRIWLHRMPPAVVKKVTPKNKKEKQLTLLYGLPFLIFMIGYPIYYVLQVDSSLLEIFCILLAFFIAFDLWDTLILDLLIFCMITPRFIKINGTEKNDYGNKKYHISSGLKGIVMTIIFSVIISIILFFIRT